MDKASTLIEPMKTRRNLFVGSFLTLILFICVAGIKIVRLPRTTTFPSNTLFAVSVGTGTANRVTYHVQAHDLARGLGPWITNIVGGSAFDDSNLVAATNAHFTRIGVLDTRMDTAITNNHTAGVALLNSLSVSGNFVSGSNNAATAPGSFVVGGRGNGTVNAPFSGTVGGQGNLGPDRQATNSVIIGGLNHDIIADISILNIGNDVIAGGENNLLDASRNSLILGGYFNMIGDLLSGIVTTNVMILGGNTNTSLSSYSTIIGGEHNLIPAAAEHTWIIGSHLTNPVPNSILIGPSMNNAVHITSNGTTNIGDSYFPSQTAQTFAVFDGGKKLAGTIPTNSFSTHAQLTTASNTVYSTLVTLSSNNVRVAAGDSMSISSSGAGGVQTYTVNSTALVTNVTSLANSNATSKPILHGVVNRTAQLMGIEAGANVTVTPNGSNLVITASGGSGDVTTAQLNTASNLLWSSSHPGNPTGILFISADGDITNEVDDLEWITGSNLLRIGAGNDGQLQVFGPVIGQRAEISGESGATTHRATNRVITPLLQVGSVSNITMTVGDNLHVNGTNYLHRYVPSTNATLVFTNLSLNTPVKLRIETTNGTEGWALTFSGLQPQSWGSNGVPVIATNGGPTIIEVVRISNTETNARVVDGPELKLQAGRNLQIDTNYNTLTADIRLKDDITVEDVTVTNSIAFVISTVAGVGGANTNFTLNAMGPQELHLNGATNVNFVAIMNWAAGLQRPINVLITNRTATPRPVSASAVTNKFIALGTLAFPQENTNALYISFKPLGSSNVIYGMQFCANPDN